MVDVTLAVGFRGAAPQGAIQAKKATRVNTSPNSVLPPVT